MKIKKIIYIIGILACVCFASCDNDDEISVVSPDASGEYTDSRDGETYGWVRYAGLDWMTENFRYDVGDSNNSSVYVDVDEYETNPTSTEHLSKYGRLYSHSAAVSAVPDGWRLPTEADWAALENAAGSYLKDAIRLQYGGYYTLNTIMGTSGWRFRGCYGFYWSADQDDSKSGEYYFYRKTVYNTYDIVHESQETANQLSIRLVRDAR